MASTNMSTIALENGARNILRTAGLTVQSVAFGVRADSEFALVHTDTPETLGLLEAIAAQDGCPISITTFSTNFRFAYVAFKN